MVGFVNTTDLHTDKRREEQRVSRVSRRTMRSSDHENASTENDITQTNNRTPNMEADTTMAML